MLAQITPRAIFAIAILGLCGLIPTIAAALGEPFYMDIFARMMIWAIAAVSLNLILGYGGMISFGHAAYLGIGGYVVGICAYHEVESALVQWPLALALCAIIALFFGAISLRTRGVYFIMITMALTQMIYFLSVSAEEYGSDDGLVIYTRSQFGTDWYDLDKPLHLYYTIFAALMLCLYVTKRLVESRFGMVIRGAQSNEQRMEAIGFSTYRYRLVCFVIAGVMCGVAGLLSANVEKFISPDTMYWTRSGELIFMVVLGGMGSLIGPVAGALVFWLLAEFLSRITEHWHLFFGPFLVLVVLFARRGIDGLFGKAKTGHG
ncbi:MAG: branched-chain amino acid ABC transporter permease [Gammaproteobacteria bacterium]